MKDLTLIICILHDYIRYEVTGLTEEHLEDGMSLREVQTKILEILYNGESVARPKLDGGKAKLLVGHSLEHDLNCLRIKYPRDLLRYNRLLTSELGKSIGISISSSCTCSIIKLVALSLNETINKAMQL